MTTTQLGRTKLVTWPDLNDPSGSSQVDAIQASIEVLSDNASSRIASFTTIADSTTSAIDHSLGANIDQLDVLIYTGAGATKTLLLDSVAAGYVIAETAGQEKTSIDVTAPGAGGPHTFVVVIMDTALTPHVVQHLIAVAPAAPVGAILKTWWDSNKRGLSIDSASFVSTTQTLSPFHVSSSFNAVPGRHYIVDTSGGAVTATLPATIQNYDVIQFSDSKKTFNSNNLTIARNTNDIDSETEDLVLSVAGDGALLVGDNTASNWVKSGGGGGGGLIPVFIDSGTTPAFTAEVGNHYFVDATSAAVAVTLTQDEGQVRFSEGAAAGSWGTNNVTVTSGGGQTIEGDATLVGDVDETWVQLTLNEGKTDWLTEDAFVPTLSDGTTGTGEGGINYVTNSDAEDGIVEGVSATTVDVAQDVGTPIWGTASFELTSQASIGNVDWAIDITDSAPAASGLSLGVLGYFQTDANGSEGDWTVGIYNVTDAAYASEETDLKVDIQNIYRSIFTPLAGKTYVFRLRRVDTTISHVVLADKLTVTPDSNSSLVAFEQRTVWVDENIQPLTANIATSSLNLNIRCEYVGGRYFLEGSLWGVLSTDLLTNTEVVFTLTGLTLVSIPSGNRVASSSWTDGGASETTASIDPPGDRFIIYNKSGSPTISSGGHISMYFSSVELEKPTWFDANLDDNKVNLLTQDVVQANVRSRWVVTNTTYITTTNIDYDTEDTSSVWSGNVGTWANTDGEITIPVDGTYQITASIETSGANWVADNNLVINIGGVLKARLDRASGAARGVKGAVTIDLSKGDLVALQINGTQTLASDPAQTYLSIVRLQDYGAFDPIGFALSTPTQAGLERARTVVSSVYLNAAMSGIADGANPTITFDNVDNDISGIWNVGTSSFEPTIAGWYKVSASVWLIGTSEAVHITSSCQTSTVNGISLGLTTGEVDANGNKVHNGSRLFYFNGTTDSISINATMDTTGATWQVDSTSRNTWFDIFLVRAD